MSTLRIASFNVENLFQRAKLLNLPDRKETTRLLKKVDELQRVLKEVTYSAAHKKKISALCKELRGYVEVRTDRGKLFKGMGTGTVGATGRKSWDGEVIFTPERIEDGARESTAEVIKAVKADVCCVVEAEDRIVLDDFNDALLKTTAHFEQTLLIDGNDRRGIDVGVLSKLPLGAIRTHMYEKDPATGRELFSRDCLHVEVLLKGGKVLHLLCNHFKSKMNNDAKSDAKRKRQAERVAEIVKEFDLAKDLVVVAGDLNDTPESDPLNPLLKTRQLYDALELQYGADMKQRWTYKYKSQLNQIDYLLMSKPLKDAFVAAGVERRGMFGVEKITGVDPFESVTKREMAASDHGAVWVEVGV